MKRVWVPSPIILTWSRAAMLNFNSRPLISVSTAVAVIISPTFVARECSIFRAVPTVVCPSSKWGATAIIAAFSIKAHIAGVANTAKSPEPIYSAVTSAVTFIVAVNDNPSFIIIYIFLRDKFSENFGEIAIFALIIMRNRVVILLLLSLFLLPSAVAQRRSQGYWHQEWTVDKGDTIPLVHLLPIRKYARKPDMRRYQRLVRMVKKCYPLAKQARMEMEKMERELLAVKDPKEQQKLAKEMQKRLIKQYTPVILKMTFSEGKVLLKLIDRETDYTAYQIIKEFRGGFVAGFFQTMAKLFGNNLKLEYEPETNDRVLEQIVTYY